MASMKDVAKMAGVSISTVSRVINDTHPVDGRTRGAVEDAIRRINYRPNLLAAGLRSKSGNLIGLAVPDIAHHSFEEFIKHTEQCVREHKHGLIIGDTHSDPDAEAEFIDHLIRRNVDGIIFIRVSDQSRALDMLNATSIPYVVLDRALESGTVPTVTMDNFTAGQLAAEHLLGLGHSRIACLTGPLDVALCRERLNGFTQALSHAGHRLPDQWIFEGDFRFESGVRTVELLLDTEPRITALWAQNDLMAIGIIGGLIDHGLVVPRDMSVAGVDDIVTCRMVRPQLTTVSQPFEAMSRAAVQLLMRERSAGKRLTERIVIPTELVVRQSTAPPADSTVSPHLKTQKELL
ncbi:MAG: LacI family transcriptional regulator [Spirochaetaceae bacterium]|nr:MAG: LacI family transcriptional regulator [Spirochaetaceae bacterium]